MISNKKYFIAMGPCHKAVRGYLATYTYDPLQFRVT